MSWSKRDWFFCLILAVVTILAYQHAWHGGFLWDDDAYIINNELLTAPDGWQRIWFSSIPPRSISRSLIAHFESSMLCGAWTRLVITGSTFCFMLAMPFWCGRCWRG